MRTIGLLLTGLLFILNSCTDDTTTNGVQLSDCPVEDQVKVKETAKALIVGKWNWVKTTYTSRSAGITTVTPLSTDKTLTYEFTAEKVRMSDNNGVREELYEIKFWGEGSNMVDNILTVKFFTLTGEYQGTSMLFLSSSGTCLTLVNSYNDIGGDLNFKRAD